MRKCENSFCFLSINFFYEGGPTYKIKHLKTSLEKLSINIDLFNQWENINNYDLVHLFNAHSGTYHLAKVYKIKILNIL